jgi:poly-gamma-glutamate capsule biosynthesis protein CapA/YwtB (metallophosphatase superfamily)
MHRKNISCLAAAHIDACALANNHVLDWLDLAGVAHSGAGNNLKEAMAPAVLPLPNRGRVLVFSFGAVTSGIPWAWRAASDRAGVHLLDDLSEATATGVATYMQHFQQPNDVLIASIHWGGNWGYEIPAEQIAFAHRLIDEGASIVHGHSSHHVKGIEVYRNRLVLYGCGDFLTDYEGITGHERFRGDLGLMYLIEVDLRTGRLISTRFVPMQMRRFRLNHASVADAQWLARLLNQLGTAFKTDARLMNKNQISLSW